jgi:hypothetical protein
MLNDRRIRIRIRIRIQITDPDPMVRLNTDPIRIRIRIRNPVRNTAAEMNNLFHVPLSVIFIYCLGCEYDELKSPISLVHEIALKRSLTVLFEVNDPLATNPLKIFK